MKVGTDGVLLGAWADVSDAKRVLDIGAGTGLISLMVAQRSNAEAVAVEIDADAAKEATMNFDESPWRDRLQVVNKDFIEYVDTCTEKFDVIISNPPYFINSLESPDDKRTKARHTGTLSFEQLICGAEMLLSRSGHIYLITPSDAETVIDKIVEVRGLYVVGKTYVIPVVGAEPKRILWDITRSKSDIIIDSITIEIARHIYTDKYIDLTRDFYINM